MLIVAVLLMVLLVVVVLLVMLLVMMLSSVIVLILIVINYTTVASAGNSLPSVSPLEATSIVHILVVSGVTDSVEEIIIIRIIQISSKPFSSVCPADDTVMVSCKSPDQQKQRQ